MTHRNEQPADAGEQAAGSRANRRNKIMAQCRKYLKYGFNVIPCWPRTKSPSIREWKPYQNRLATEEEIDNWFSNGERNVAIITGKISKIFALDTDVKKHPGAEEFLNGKPLPDTLKNITHNGIQYIFRYPTDLDIPPIVALGGVVGVDIRGDGSYIMVYPSIHPENTRYRWERPKEGDLIKYPPEWLLDAISIDKVNRDKEYQHDYKKVFDGDYISEGERNNTLTSLVGKLRTSGILFKEALIILECVNQTKCKPPLEVKEIESIVKSVYSYEIGKEIKLIRLSNVAEPPKRKWFLEGLFPEKYPSMVYAGGSIGKSFFALFMATQASRRRQSFLGKHFLEEPLISLFLDWELELDEITCRAYQVARGLGLSKPPDGLLYYTPKVNLYRLLKELPKIIESEGIRFMVIDSLGASCVDPDRVIDVIEVFTELKSLGVTTQVFDHQPKLQSNDSYESKTPYGSVYKFNLSRSVFQLSPLTTSTNPLQLQLIHTKSNFGRRSDALRFEIRFEGDRVLFTESKAPSKDEKEMRLIHEAIVELKEKGIETLQKNIINALKGVLGKDKTIELLSKGEGKFWDLKPREGRGGGKVYEPKEVFWNSDYIYTPKTRKLPNDQIEDYEIPEVIA